MGSIALFTHLYSWLSDLQSEAPRLRFCVWIPLLVDYFLAATSRCHLLMSDKQSLSDNVETLSCSAARNHRVASATISSPFPHWPDVLGVGDCY